MFIDSHVHFDRFVKDGTFQEILDRSKLWEAQPKQRLFYFARYLGHEDSQLRSLAHIEVAKAPYNEIRDLGDILSREELHSFLGNMRYVEWHSLYILLLAQSSEEQDRQIIADRIRSAERFGISNQLAAWATAWIETEQGIALDFFEAHYFSEPSRSVEEMSSLLMALSVHGTNGHVHLRDRIIDGYRLILANHPSLAPHIVTDLTAWKRRDLAPELAAILTTPPPSFDLMATMQLRSYLSNVSGSQLTAETSGFIPGQVLILVLLVLFPIGLAVTKTMRRRSRRR